MLIINAPEGYVELLGELPDGCELSETAGGKFDFVQMFAKDNAELDLYRSSAMEAVTFDGIFWLCYPKKSSKVKSDLSRDIVWKLMQGTGLRPVTQISIDQTWSALRFRPEEKVGK